VETHIAVNFSDGSSGQFSVRGEAFRPSTDELFLFVFPDGAQKEGRVRSLGLAEPGAGALEAEYDALAHKVEVLAG
jgi:hypothetical protein